MPNSPTARLLLILGFITLLVLTGYYGTEAIRLSQQDQNQLKTNEISSSELTFNEKPTLEKSSQRDRKSRKHPFAIDGEHVLTFGDDKELEDFLRRIRGTSIELLGRNNRLNSLRLRTSDFAWLKDLAGKANIGNNYAVFIPRPEPGSVQPGAVGFGASFLDFLGISGDIRSWGEGVTVALIDSGVEEHPTFTQDFKEFNLIDSNAPDSTGHGTSMASLIIGSNPQAPGIAPSSDLISYRVIDSSGTSNTFLVADAITQAADAGADVINISLGTYGDSRALQLAVDYANEQGALIIASAGNEELNTLALPAGYPGVIAVGAVEARGEHLNFSNTSDFLDISSPGLQIRAAFPDLRLVDTSGTSPAAAITTAGVAAIMSQNPDLTAQEAYNRLAQSTNEANIAGPDSFTGGGLLNIGKAMREPDVIIPDVAVADITLLEDESELHVVFENRGTTITPAGTVGLVEIDGAVTEVPLRQLEPNETQSFITNKSVPEGQQTEIRTEVNVPQGQEDFLPQNNFRQETLPIIEESE